MTTIFYDEDDEDDENDYDDYGYNINEMSPSLYVTSTRIILQSQVQKDSRIVSTEILKTTNFITDEIKFYTSTNEFLSSTYLDTNSYSTNTDNFIKPTLIETTSLENEYFDYENDDIYLINVIKGNKNK